MFRRSDRIGGVRTLFRRVSIAILILVFSLHSSRQITTAQAAPPSDDTITNMRFYLNVSNPGTLCAGQEYSIAVTPLVDLDGERQNGEKFSDKERIITGVPITAEITDTNIATVEPAKPQSKKSGYLPGSLTGTSSLSMQEKLGGLGEVVFKLTAKKAGTTNFYLTAKVPSQWSGGRDKYFGPQGMPVGGAIKVVNCKYRVIMTYQWEGSGDISGWWYGHLTTEIATTGGELYEGAGSFDFFGHINIPDCSSTWSAFTIPTKITGTKTTASSMEFIELNFNYGKATTYATASCPEGSAAGSGTADAMANGGIRSALFEPEGQTLVFAVPGIGSPAKMTITLKPITEQGGK